MSAEQLITKHLDIWTSAHKTRSSAGRGSSNKLDLYGIRKLRELILELAVRGKLVPQDPSEKPASELIKLIRDKKQSLIKSGAVKNVKMFDAISSDALSFEIPSNWSVACLGDLVNVLNGRAYKKHEMLSEGTPLLRVGNLFTSNEWYYSDLELEPEKYIDNGDLIYAWSASFGPFIWEGEKVIYHYHIWKLDFFEPSLISKKFMLHYLTSITQSIKASGNGIAMIHMTKERMEKLAMQLPPLEEQHRIVEKVDELMAFCDELEQAQTDNIAAHAQLVEALLTTLTNSKDHQELQANWQRIAEHFDTLFTTEASIDQLKQTILQLAVMGKLVPQDPNDEPASELLKKIAAEKAQLIKEGKIKKEKQLPEITDEEEPFKSPEGWSWCRLANVTSLITSGSRDWAKYLSDDGAIFVTMANLSRADYKLRTDTMRYVNPPVNGEGARTKLEENDLIVSITGDVGNLGLIPNNFGDAYINQHTCLLRFMPMCQNLYFPELLRSPLAKIQFDTPQRGIKNSFRLSDVGEMIIPLPPLNEQYRIVEQLNILMELCSSLKNNLVNIKNIQCTIATALVEQVVFN